MVCGDAVGAPEIAQAPLGAGRAPAEAGVERTPRAHHTRDGSAYTAHGVQAASSDPTLSPNPAVCPALAAFPHIAASPAPVPTAVSPAPSAPDFFPRRAGRVPDRPGTRPNPSTQSLPAGTRIQLWCATAAARLGDEANARVGPDQTSGILAGGATPARAPVLTSRMASAPGSSSPLYPATPAAFIGRTDPVVEPAPHDAPATGADAPACAVATFGSLATPAVIGSTITSAAASSDHAVLPVVCSAATAPAAETPAPAIGGQWVCAVLLGLDAASGAHAVAVEGGPPALVHLDREHWATVRGYGGCLGRGHGVREARGSPGAAASFTPTACVRLRKPCTTPTSAGAIRDESGGQAADGIWWCKAGLAQSGGGTKVSTCRPASDPATAAARSRHASRC